MELKEKDVAPCDLENLDWILFFKKKQTKKKPNK